MKVGDYVRTHLTGEESRTGYITQSECYGAFPFFVEFFGGNSNVFKEYELELLTDEQAMLYMLEYS
jgi:hypothetical protein